MSKEQLSDHKLVLGGPWPKDNFFKKKVTSPNLHRKVIKIKPEKLVVKEREPDE